MIFNSKDFEQSSNTHDDEDISDNRSSISGRDDEESDSNQIAGKETRAVLKLRMSVIVVLVACAIAVSTAIYKLTHASEHEAFQIQYKGSAEKVMKAFEDILEVQAGALASLSVAITTQGKKELASIASVFYENTWGCMYTFIHITNIDVVL
jgi:hypothetical protein